MLVIEKSEAAALWFMRTLGGGEPLTDAERFAAIVKFSNDAIITKNLNGIITSWNPAAERMFGYLAEEAIGSSVTILIPPERRNEEPLILDHIGRGLQVGHYETVRRRKDGTDIDVSLTVSPIKNAAGVVVGASKIARDITDRKRHEAQIAALAGEAEHRAKNLLAVVRAIVRLSHARTADDLKQAIEGRLRALAHVHAPLVQTRSPGAELWRMVSEELSPFSRDGARASIKGPKVLLTRDAAQTVVVAVHELATNAAKYGALSVECGHVDVSWSRVADGSLVILWTETGGPSVDIPSHQGFGTRVINQMMRGIDAEVVFHWRAEGLDCRLVLPPSAIECPQ